MKAYYSSQYGQMLIQVGEMAPAVANHLVSAMRYLCAEADEAVAPDIKWNLKTSVYGDKSGEVVWPYPEAQSEFPDQAWRGLFVAADDFSWVLFTVLGNKAVGTSRGNSWYVDAIVKADEIAAAFIKARCPPNPPLAVYL